MSVQRKRIVVALAVAAVAVWGYNLRLLFNPDGHDAGDEVGKGTGSSSYAVPRAVYNPGGRDPFYCDAFMREAPPAKRAARAPATAPPSCTVTGIVYNQTRPMAMIWYEGKSHMVKAGDIVGALQIQAVEKDTVRVVYQGKRFALGK